MSIKERVIRLGIFAFLLLALFVIVYVSVTWHDGKVWVAITFLIFLASAVVYSVLFGGE
jgi:hypothetical protein